MAKTKSKINPLAAKILGAAEYTKVLENSPFEHDFTDFLGIKHYVNQANAKTEARYGAEVAAKNYAIGFPKMIFFRLLDQNGNRVFSTQKHLDTLLEDTDMKWLLNVGEEILAWDLEQTSVSDQIEDAKKN